jgi:outer membrane protein assembly factor BamA
MKSFLLLTFLFSSLLVSGQDSSLVVISDIKIIGNKKTKDFIILRELTFKVNDTVPKSTLIKNLEQSKFNLTNTFLFNFITINTVKIDEEKIEVVLILEERWYIFPVPIFTVAEPNFNTWWETKDLNRASYGAYIALENLTGRNDPLRLIFQTGYSSEFGFLYSLPYIDKKKQIGFSITSLYNNKKEAIYGTYDNKRLFLKLPDEKIQEKYFSSFRVQFRKKLYNTHYFNVSHTGISIEDTLAIVNENYIINKETKSSFLSMGYRFVHNKTDYLNYPLKGHYVSFSINKIGLGVIDSDINMFFSKLWLRKFFQLSENTYYSTSLEMKLSKDVKQPYFLQEGLGYNDYIRGFEYYIIDGQQFTIFRNQIRYALLPQSEVIVDYIPFEKFKKIPYALYLGIYNDTGFLNDNFFANNPKANTFLNGSGISLDFVTYYDRILRLEFGFNNFAQTGIFIHFTTPI